MNFFELLNLDEKELFKTSVLIFDSSALLELYFHDEKAAIEILEKCRSHFKKNMYITDQIVFEYEKNRESIITKPYSLYEELISSKSENGYINKIFNEIKAIKKFVDEKIIGLEKTAKNFKEHYGQNDKHLFLEIELINDINKFIEDYSKSLKESLEKESEIESLNIKINEEIKKKKEEMKNKKEKIDSNTFKDAIKTKIFEIFLVGKNYTYSQIIDIVKEGAFRYSNSIPPGYMDNEKKGFQKYGDLIIWKQIIEICKEKNKNCVFVSNDTKEDWNDKELNGPRQELVREFNEFTGKLFSKYTLKEFIYRLNKYSNSALNPESMEAIEKYYFNDLLRDNIQDNFEEFLEEIRDDLEDMFFEIVGEESEIEDEEYDIEDIKILEIVGNVCRYRITIYCYIIKTYRDYWGRDDDTKDMVLSPWNYIKYKGNLIYDVSVEFTQEEEEIIEFGEMEYELKKNNVKEKYKPWWELENDYSRN